MFNKQCYSNYSLHSLHVFSDLLNLLNFFFRDLVEACGKALDINRLLIKPDQVAYHKDLAEHYLDLKQKVSSYLTEVSERFSY